MSLINNMEMAKALFAKSCIAVKKSFFGLKEKVLYKNTNSPVVGCDLEFSPTDGEKLEKLLSRPLEHMSNMELTVVSQDLGMLHPAENGMYDLTLCYSQDHQFAALQLTKYLGFEYRPVSELHFVEGDCAQTLLQHLAV
ncbi:hypothetical protein [Fibrobacter sp. UWEL]|uniref:hypothetical protein n=1 Tax=Fibrobacter sp. UWEL TaxID=1896209 RepID=UPI00091BB932|nr:hypothetical protein [Fibrobacter sp. UWEL]SHL01020.1 hypothetical protein SAMN05720468_11169 [Fibrobacter sp. UWEL]